MAKKLGTIAVAGSNAVKVVDANPQRTRLHLRALSATGVVLGTDETVEQSTTPSNGYFLSQNADIVLEDYKGAVYARRPTVTDVDLSYWEET